MIFRRNLPICLLIAFVFIIFAYHSLYRHRTYNSHAFDLGIYTQVTYLYSQGQAPLSTLKHMNILGDHFGPILFLLSPVYKIFPDAQTLLIIQALFVSLSGIFIYLIALDKLKDKALSFIITLAYLSAPGILSAVNFDFHLATISVLPLSLMLYSWYFKRWKLYWPVLFLSLLFKEDIPIFIVGLGLFLCIKRQIKPGILTVFLGLLSYYLIKYQIIGRISAGAEDAYIGTSILPFSDPLKLLYLLFTQPGILLNVLFEPATKMHTLLILYGQLIFLPFLSVLSWLTVFPYLFLRFSSTLPHYWGTYFHYNANLAPFLTASAIFALKDIKFSKSLILILLILAVVISNFRLNTLILNSLQFDFKETNRFSYLNRTLPSIPKEKAVSAQSPIVPHLSNRNKIYLYPEVLDADYIILDESLGYYPMQYAEFKDKISALKKDPNWVLEQKVNTLLVFKKV